MTGGALSNDFACCCNCCSNRAADMSESTLASASARSSALMSAMFDDPAGQRTPKMTEMHSSCSRPDCCTRQPLHKNQCNTTCLALKVCAVTQLCYLCCCIAFALLGTTPKNCLAGTGGCRSVRWCPPPKMLSTNQTRQLKTPRCTEPLVGASKELDCI
jgi:hypothetical protein